MGSLAKKGKEGNGGNSTGSQFRRESRVLTGIVHVNGNPREGLLQVAWENLNNSLEKSCENCMRNCMN